VRQRGEGRRKNEEDCSRPFRLKARRPHVVFDLQDVMQHGSARQEPSLGSRDGLGEQRLDPQADGIGHQPIVGAVKGQWSNLAGLVVTDPPGTPCRSIFLGMKTLVASLRPVFPESSRGRPLRATPDPASLRVPSRPRVAHQLPRGRASAKPTTECHPGQGLRSPPLKRRDEYQSDECANPRHLQGRAAPQHEDHDDQQEHPPGTKPACGGGPAVELRRCRANDGEEDLPCQGRQCGARPRSS
jgi:hypothetical protein